MRGDERLIESSRPYRGVLVAALCGLTLFARVYTEYPIVRLKLVTQARPAAQGALSIEIPPVPQFGELTGPIALIAHFENATATDISIDVSWNATHIGVARLGASRRARFDFTLPEGAVPRAGDRLWFRGPSGPWQLGYLEIANVHGSSRGLLNAVFVPAAARNAPARGWLVPLFVTVVLALIARRAAPPWSWKSARVLHNVLIVAVVLVFATSLLSPIVSRFKVLIAWNSFWLYATLALLRELWRSISGLWNAFVRRWPGLAAASSSVVIALLVAGFFTLLMFDRLTVRYDGNYSGFLQLDRTRIRNSPLLVGRDDIKKTLSLTEGGYDGMYMYFMAYDPFLLTFKDTPGVYWQIVDGPPYRYARVGFSLLTKLCSWNHPEWFPNTMIWLIIVSHFAAALALGGILRHGGWNPAWALLYIVVPGFVQSLYLGLPESIAAMGMLTAVWLMLRSRMALAALCLAMTLLVRETGAIFVLMMVLWLWGARREWRAGFIVGLAVAPLVAWRAYIAWRLFPVSGWSGFFFSPGTVGLPFRGIVDLWATIGRGEYYPWYPPLAAAGRLYPLVLVAALIASLALLWKRRDGLSLAAVAFSVLALSLDYQHVWLHVGSAERVSFDVFVLLLAGLATLGREVRAQRAVLLAFFAFTAVYTLFYSFDASAVRTALQEVLAAAF